MKNNTLQLFLFVLLISCNNKEKPTPANQNNINLNKKPTSWISNRVKNANNKFKESQAGKLVLQSINAHGGLTNWFDKSALSFRFDYLPMNGKTPRKTIQQIDLWSNRAVHQDTKDNNDRFGFDGKKTWIKRNDTSKFDFDVKFWALTPYYFVGQPFIFDGKGVNLKKIEDQTLFSEPYDAVKITYDAGTGDAPDDYYINYYEKETHLLKAIKYIVSYPSYFKNGGHSPEKLMVITKYKTVENIVLAAEYETYSTDSNGFANEKITEVFVSDIKFMPKIKDNYFEMPNGAEVIK